MGFVAADSFEPTASVAAETDLDAAIALAQNARRLFPFGWRDGQILRRCHRPTVDRDVWCRYRM